MPTQPERIDDSSRVTLFPLGGLTVAYTTRSSDKRRLGDIGIVAVTAPDTAKGEDLWSLARSMWARPTNSQEQARWILTQAIRARIVQAPAYQNLPDAKWAAELTRRFHLDALFANHQILATGRLTLA
ncbi:hypothetical protein [Streptomyces sp. NPDC000410]|uniref:hypothetical protein n=1 Tax=Streptomyces sp. NPDC000410 TaxID=3154254 RepID=UPI00331C0EA5